MFSRFKNTKYLHDELKRLLWHLPSYLCFKNELNVSQQEIRSSQAMFPDLGQALKNPFFFRDLLACPAPGPMAWWLPPRLPVQTLCARDGARAAGRLRVCVTLRAAYFKFWEVTGRRGKIKCKEKLRVWGEIRVLGHLLELFAVWRNTGSSGNSSS